MLEVMTCKLSTTVLRGRKKLFHHPELEVVQMTTPFQFSKPHVWLQDKSTKLKCLDLLCVWGKRHIYDCILHYVCDNDGLVYYGHHELLPISVLLHAHLKWSTSPGSRHYLCSNNSKDLRLDTFLHLFMNITKLLLYLANFVYKPHVVD